MVLILLGKLKGLKTKGSPLKQNNIFPTVFKLMTVSMTNEVNGSVTFKPFNKRIQKFARTLFPM